ncbi:Metallo-hydrolase/oxidoreductase [Marasmius fiardii PR-910]|nr:Metallo-hydrolase/oxidoreductase [Marasmius fiardii PR-910]
MSSSPAEVNIPQSTSTVSVRVFSIFADSTKLPVAMVWEPVLPGRETYHLPGYAFLIEHKGSKRRVMFDLGMRKDHDGFSPQIQTAFSPGLHFIIERDIVEQLQDGGVELESIEAVIWSHTHLDHTGDMSKWPSSTRLIIGPGSDRRGYPTVPDALLLDSDFADREVEELTFVNSSLRIAGLAAIDFFKDGSLYILDMPGHLPGHIVALARVQPNSFILLGGDTCHHVGQIRPNPHIHKSFPCPGNLLSVIKASISTEHFPSFHADMGQLDLSNCGTPLLTVPHGPSVYTDRERSIESQKTLGLLDAHPDVFVIIAHDTTLVGVISLFPDRLDDWKEKGWKEKAVWSFVDPKNKAFVFSPC